ncbi:glycosyltransferase [bacterium]|nr:glycosyltransferase [bacterium]
MTRRILVLTTDPLPLPGLPATGAGMRAWGLGLGLRAAGLGEVTIACAADAARGRSVPFDQIPGVASFERSELDAFIASRNPDAIVFQHWGLMSEMKKKAPCPVAVDLAGPHLLERQLWDSKRPAEDLAEKLRALALADFTTCSGRFQRHYFMPFLLQAGHDPRSQLCPVIPFSLAPDQPLSDPDRDFSRFLFSGMFLPWQDPEKTLRTALEAMEEKQRGKLVFIGGPHPAGDVSGGRFDRLLEFLSSHPMVEMQGTQPFDKLIDVMRGCAVAVDLMPRNAERELAYPTRTVTYMWAGLPVIHNNYDELAEPIERAKAGWTFDENDTDGVRRLVQRLLGHREDTERRSANARRLVAEGHAWDRTIEPLAKWCANPTERRGKRTAVAVPAATVAEAAESVPAKRTQRTIRYSPPAPKVGPGRTPIYLQPFVFLLALPISMVLLLLFGLAELPRMLFRSR